MEILKGYRQIRIDNYLVVFALILVLAGGIAKGELVAHWKLDKTNDRVIDSSGKGNDGSLVNMPRYVPGVFGQALAFDGATQTIPKGFSGQVCACF